MTFTHATTRENAARAPSRSTLAAPFREAWAAPLRFGMLAHDGLLFVTDKQDHTLALDAVTGKRVWTSPWPSVPRLVHEGRLFTQPVDRDELHLVDPHTGHPQSALFAPQRGELLAIGDRLFASMGLYGDGVVSALDWKSGQRLWSVRPTGNVQLKPHFCATASAIVHGITDRSDSANTVDALVARRPDTGAELWRRPGELRGIPAIHGDSVVAGLGDRVTALSLRDGALLWETEGTGGYLYGDRYYCLKGSYSEPPVYQVLDVASGKTLARVDLLARLPKTLRNTRPQSVLFVSESHVFVHGSWNDFLLVFTRDGEYVWNHHPTGAHITGEVVGGDGRFYCRHRERLFCLESVSR